MGFKFTLFNSITLVILGVALFTLVSFARRKLDRNWPFPFYLLILAYWKIFEGAFHAVWIFTGLACGILLRFRILPERIRRVLWWVELAALAYILLRSADLLLGGEIFYWLTGCWLR